MLSRRWIVIAASIVFLLALVLVPSSNTAAGDPLQTVQGSVGNLACVAGPPISETQSTTACWENNCSPIEESATHTLTVPFNTQLTIQVTVQTPGCHFVSVSFFPPEACTVDETGLWGSRYTCFAPDSGQLRVQVSGYASYTLTVTEIEVVEPPPHPITEPYETPMPEPPIIEPDPETAAGVQRINQWQAIPYIVYVPTAEHAAAENTQFIDIWHLDANGVGQPLLYISKEELLALPAMPTEDIVIATSYDGLAYVYKLTTGEFQVNIGPLDDGKLYTTTFDAIPPTTVTHSTWVMQ